ncbi:hypothetical protein RFI_37751, partial [Reticulomyxa filosa]
MIIITIIIIIIIIMLCGYLIQTSKQTDKTRAKHLDCIFFLIWMSHSDSDSSGVCRIGTAVVVVDEATEGSDKVSISTKALEMYCCCVSLSVESVSIVSKGVRDSLFFGAACPFILLVF